MYYTIGDSQNRATSEYIDRSVASLLAMAATLGFLFVPKILVLTEHLHVRESELSQTSGSRITEIHQESRPTAQRPKFITSLLWRGPYFSTSDTGGTSTRATTQGTRDDDFAHNGNTSLSTDPRSRRGSLNERVVSFYPRGPRPSSQLQDNRAIAARVAMQASNYTMQSSYTVQSSYSQSGSFSNATEAEAESTND